MRVFIPGSRCGAHVATLLICSLIIADGHSAPGDLDPEFGDSGRVLLDPHPGTGEESAAYGLVRQADGRLVVAATSKAGTSHHVVVTRLTVDGALDPTFGNGGLTEGWTLADRASDVIETSNGSLVVAGSTAANIAIWRFDANGMADASFGAGGLASQDLGGEDHAVTVVEQPDGKYVIAGTSRYTDTEDSEHSDIVLARLTADGLPDKTFGNGGITLIPSIEDGTWEVASALLSDRDGNLFVFGNRYGGSDHYGTTVIARLNRDGVLDSTFGNDGQLEFFFGAGEEHGTITYAAALDAQGRIVFGGGIGFLWWIYLFSSDAFVARLMPDGTLDNDFGDAGIVRATSNVWAEYRTLLVEPDGGIIAGGIEYIEEARSPDPYDTRAAGPYMRVTRILGDGTPDPTFGTAGTSVVDFGHGNEAPYSNATALIRNDDGSLVLAGNQADLIALARVSRVGADFAGYIGFAATDHNIEESAGSSIITVRRTGGFNGTVSVAYETHSDTAVEWQDYEPQSGQLVWDDGDVSKKVITIPLINDSQGERGERFGVTLSDPTGGALVAASEMSIVIENEDPFGSGSGPSITNSGAHSGAGRTGWFSLLVLGLLTVVRLAKHHAARR